MPRRYDNRRRAEQAAETTRRIADATEALVARGPLGEVTLQAIAADAGVTVQTVLRHMGSREGCFAAVRERVMARIEAQRGGTPPGDVDAALDDLLTHYEREGRLVLHLLAQAGEDPFAGEAAAAGRAYHRRWVERVFRPLLGRRERRAVDALVAATDLYVWKLLRLDLGRSRAETRAVIAQLVRASLPPETP